MLKITAEEVLKRYHGRKRRLKRGLIHKVKSESNMSDGDRRTCLIPHRPPALQYALYSLERLLLAA